MKHFLRTVFFTDFPAQGAFAGIILFLTGLAGTVSFLVAADHVPAPGRLFPAGLYFSVIPVILLFYALYVNGRFFFKWGGAKALGRNIKYLLPAVLVLGAALYGLLHIYGLVLHVDRYFSCHSRQTAFLLPEKFHIPAVYGGVFLLVVFLFLTAKLYADSQKLPLKALFGKCVIFCVILLGAVWGLQTFGGIKAEKDFQKQLDVLEKHFKAPVSCEAMEKRYLSRGRVDAAFWEKVQKLSDVRFKILLDEYPEIVVPEKTLHQFRKEFESSVPLQELEKLFSSPLPLVKRTYAKGKLVTIRLEILARVRSFARKQLWRIRFAVDRKDPEAVIDALERIRYCSDFLTKNEFLISALVMIAVEELRFNGLQQALPVLSQGQLLRQKSYSARLREKLPAVYNNAVYAETVMGFDHLSGFFRQAPAIFPLFPALKYNYFRSLKALAEYYQAAPAEAVQCRPYSRLRDLFGSVFGVTRDRFKYLQARCLAMETLIDIELEKRRTGRYPDCPAKLPIDPFTGKEMRYFYGTLARPCEFWNEKNPTFPDKRLEDQKVVAVWSVGKNLKDDDAYSGFHDGRRCDDPAAVLTLK